MNRAWWLWFAGLLVAYLVLRDFAPTWAQAGFAGAVCGQAALNLSRP